MTLGLKADRATRNRQLAIFDQPLRVGVSLVKLHLSGITDDEPSPRTKKTKIEEQERGQSEAEEEDEDWVPPSNQTG